MAEPSTVRLYIRVEHVRIEAAKPLEAAKAALESLVSPLDPAIPEALRQSDIERAKEALQRGPQLAIFSARDHGDCCALSASRARRCSTRSAIPSPPVG